MKHSEEPQKFMDSELELDDVVKRLMIVAGSPELYPDLTRTQVRQYTRAPDLGHSALVTQLSGTCGCSSAANPADILAASSHTESDIDVAE